MTSLVFPDVNVWLALATPEHVHNAIARQWWSHETGTIAFSRFTQLGFLRLVSTAASMSGKPLTNREALRLYDRFFDDNRVTFLSESPAAEKRFREGASLQMAAPKAWADAWLLALAETGGGRLITFDKTLASRGALCLLAV